MMPGTDLLLFLALAGLLAGFIDSIAGGGGLITLPALLAAGVPPVQAVGTNKLQSTLGTGGAVWAFARGGHIDFKRYWPAFLPALVGGIAGALLVQWVNPAFLAVLMPLMLIMISAYFLISPRLSDADRHSRVGMVGLGGMIGAVGLYDGFFGPGAGAFYTTIFLTLGGLGVLRATAQTKAANFASNLSALMVMMLGGHVVWIAGLVMAGGSITGGLIGSHMAMRFGGRIIRPLLVVMSLSLTAKMLIDPTNPIHLYIAGL